MILWLQFQLLRIPSFRILSPTIDHFCIQCKLWLGKGKYEFIQNLNSIELIGFSQAKHVIQIILEMNLLKLLKFRLFVSDPTNLPTCPKLQQDGGVWLESPWNTHMTTSIQQLLKLCLYVSSYSRMAYELKYSHDQYVSSVWLKSRRNTHMTTSIRQCDSYLI